MRKLAVNLRHSVTLVSAVTSTPYSESSSPTTTCLAWLLATMPDPPRSPNNAARHSPRTASPIPHQRSKDSVQLNSTAIARAPQRNGGLQRASTVDIPHDKPQNYTNLPPQPASDQGHGRPADLNFTQPRGSSSRPGSRGGPSSQSDETRMGSSYRSTNISTTNVSQTSSNNSSPTTSLSVQPCSACGLAMSGQFVRALGSVYHLDCFRCKVRFSCLECRFAEQALVGL